MKKKTYLIGGGILIILALFLLSSLVPRLGLSHYYYTIPWRYHEPSIYSMQLRVRDATDEWQWRVVVAEDKPVLTTQLAGPTYDSWFNKYEFTVDGVFDAGKDFCFEIFECLIRVDSTYSYPQVLAYPPYGIAIENFNVCKTVDECLQEK